MRAAESVVRGAISIVNAIATGKGATMGISLEVHAVITVSAGSGIIINRRSNLSRRLAESTVRQIVPRKVLSDKQIRVEVSSEIPAGYGLKSSSAISSAISLACHKIFQPDAGDQEILLAGVDASMDAGVSITGAYDDACACYYGGFVVTDNYARMIERRQQVPEDIMAIVFIPASARRRNPRRLAENRTSFETAWQMAKDSDYWGAMLLNGSSAGPILGTDATILSKLKEAGALGASVSGNGPAVAATARGRAVSRVRDVLESMDGRIITSRANNRKARAHMI